MTMQRRHYELIAEAIKELPAQVRSSSIEQGDELHTQIALHFGRRLHTTNPKFDKARFLRACGVGDQ